MKKHHIAKPSDLLFGLDDTPPLSALFLLAIEHIMILMASLVAVLFFAREIGATEWQIEAFVDVGLITGGITSILQAVPKRWFGSGYFCLHINSFLYLQCSILAAMKGGLPLVFGMTAFAGIAEALFSRVIARLRVLFPPEVSGLIVASVGMALAPHAIRSMAGINQAGVPEDATSIFVGVSTFALIVAMGVWGKGAMRLYSVLAAFIYGYILSYAAGLIPESGISHVSELPFVSMPRFVFEGYSFDVSLAAPFLIAALCACAKLVGDLVTCQKINDPEWKRVEMAPISKGLVAEGIGTFLAGILGGTGLASSSSNIGMSYATGATSRRIGYASGILLIALSFLPKVIALVALMPRPVMGAIIMYAACFMIVAGWGIVMTRMIDARRTFVIGITVIMGLSVELAPGLYADINPVLKPLLGSSIALSAVTALTLNLIFRIGISSRLNLVLHPGTDTPEKIYDFFDRAGALWGARAGVVHLAMASVTELFEAASILGVVRGDIAVEARFDEFVIDVYVRYDGEEMPFPEVRPNPDDILHDESALLCLSGFLIREYATSLKSSRADGKCVINLRFDH